MYHFEIFIRAYNRITVTQHEKLKKNRSLVSKTRSDRWKKFQDSPPSTIKISKLVRRNLCSHRSKLPSSKDRDRGDLSLSAHPRRPHPSRKERFRAGIVSERRIASATSESGRRATRKRTSGRRLEEGTEEGRLNYEDKRRSGIA